MPNFFNKYPYTDFHELNLDWVLETIKQLVADWEEYHTSMTGEWNDMQEDWHDTKEAWISLKNYVENYFANLNVQDEINNKLDQMVSDGTLDNLLLPYFNQFTVDINLMITNQNNRITTLEARMDSFAQLGEGSTTGDAELMDIRVGANGITYPTAGDAVRGQFSELAAEFNDKIRTVVEYGSYSVSGGAISPVSNTTRARTPILDTAHYGTEFFIVLPSTLKVNGLYENISNTWDYGTLQDGLLQYQHFNTTASEVAFTFVNKTDNTENITQSELDSIMVFPLYVDYKELSEPGLGSRYKNINLEFGGVGVTGTSLNLVTTTTRIRTMACSTAVFGNRVKVETPYPLSIATAVQKIAGDWSYVSMIDNDATIVEIDKSATDFYIAFKNFNNGSATLTVSDLQSIKVIPIYEAPESIMAVYGAFSIAGGALSFVSNTVRARTGIMSTDVFGYSFSADIPDTLQVHSVAEKVSGSWKFCSQYYDTFTVSQDATAFIVSFSNKSNTSTPITQAELDHINLNFTHMENSDLFGKVFAALGDSITYGYIPRNYPGYPGQLESYAVIAARNTGLNLYNYGETANTVAASAGIVNPMSTRYTSMTDDADIITVMGGTNDIRRAVPLGTFTDNTNATFYGALHVLLGGLYKKYLIDQGTTAGRHKKIILITPPKLLETSGGTSGGTGTLVDMTDWIAAMKEVAAYYSIPVLDMYNLSEINPHLNQTVHGTEPGYTDYYNPYITDGTHPTQEGAVLMAKVLIDFLKGLE